MGRGTRSYDASAAPLRGAGAVAIADKLAQLRDRYRGVTLDVYARPDPGRPIHLSAIKVPDRRQGVGTRVMQDLCDLADGEARRIVLSPTDEWGSSRAGLVRFYKRFGFVENKGRHKDFEVSETMYRDPHPA